MILICDQGLLGDSIATVNVVQDIAAREATAGRTLHLMFRRDDVYSIFGSTENINRLSSLDDLWAVGLPGQTIKAADVTKAFGMQGEFSMIQAHYAILGVPVPKGIERPRIRWTQQDVPCYDYIISPFSRSDHNYNKMWPLQRWQSVIDRLRDEGNTIMVIGSTLYDQPELKNVEYRMDTSPEGKGTLDLTCSLFRNVRKAALTIDNGLSHLVHGVGCPHVLLYPACLSPIWVTNPHATIVRGNPPDIQVGQMLDAIQKTSKH